MENPGVTFVGVAGRDDENAMIDFVQNRGVGGFPNINDAEGSVWARYGVTYQPTFVFIDNSGETSTFASLSGSQIQQNIDQLF